MSTSISATAAAAAAAAATGISSSSPTSSVLWVSLLPLILITTSSILLDYVLFYETVHDRCRCQVLLWLAVVLTVVGDSNRGSSDDNDTAKNNTVAAFLLWAHATLFFNLLAILWEALQRRSMVFTASSYGQSKQSRDLLRGFPVASWTAMMAASFVVASSSNTTTATTRSTTRAIAISAQVFAATLLVLWLLGWHIHRHQRIRQELEGMPTTESIHSDPTIAAASIGLSSNRLCGGSTRGGVDCTTGFSPQSRWWHHQSLDESQWFTWNRHETIQWISQQLVPTGGSTATAGTTSSNTVMGARTGSGAAATASTDEAKQERERVLSILIPHGITGDVLDGLTLTSLLSLNVPFGPSCRLASTIVYRLVDRYPKPLSMMPTVLSPGGVAGNAHLETARRSSSNNKEEVSWLSQHDREYNNGTETDEELPTGSVSHQMTRETTVTSFQKDDYTPDGLAASVSVDPELERMEALMRERLGFELPKLRTFNGTNTDLSPTAETAVGKSTTTLPSHPLANTHGDTIGDRRPPYRDDPPLLANTYPTARPSSVPKALLDQMPSRIQEIAQRRPDLVRELLQQKRHPPPPPQEDRDQQIMERTEAITAGHPPPTTRISTTPLRRRNQQRSQISETLLGATGLDTTDEWKDGIDGGGGGDDDERTSLIQRDNHHRHNAANSLRYKSINDKMTMTPKSTGVD